MFCRFIAGMRAEVALLRFGLMAGAGIRLALCALIFALAAVVADESRAQVCDDFSKNLCGENTLCEPRSHTVICSPCPAGFAPDADNTQCVRVCPPNETPDAEGNCVCNAETHLPNPCRLKQDDATSLCEAAGWTATDLTLAARVTVGAECEIPQRDETAQTDQTGCLLWRDQAALAEIQTLTTARKLCGELPMFADNNLPLAANHDENDRYVHSCPAPKVHDADYDDCVCPAGYSTNSDGQCADINECEAQTYFCGDRVQCGNTEGSFVCGELCPNGFTLGSNRAECAETCDTTTHILNDEHHCAPLAATSAQTSRRQCDNAGWEAKTVLYATNTSVTLGVECAVPYRNATAQTDESGCWISDRGDLVFNAARNQGSTTATRRCWELFDLHGIPSAHNHDEGDRYVHSCPGEKQPSADLKSCVCPSGYVENRAGQCVDINECVSESNICGANAQCSNTIGGFACSCKTGHAKISETLTSQCADIDECAMGTHNCGQNDICENTVGGFECTLCPAGFEPGAEGSECVSACAAGLERWPNGGECVSVCPPGETRNEAGACFCNTETHIPNPCRLQTNSAIQICQDAGWMMRNITDEVSYILGQICDIPYRDATAQTDEEGCFFWLRLNPASAARLPEYTTAVHLCSDLFSGADIPQAANHNEGDRYVHTCPSGKIVSDDFKSCVCPAGYSDISGTCVDINECGNGTHACGEGGVCANTRGSYTCSCADGYQSESADTLQCSDVDECAAGTDTCGANFLCANIAGGFACGNECPSGTMPNADKSECVDICLPGETLDDSGMCVCNTETHLPNPCRLKTDSISQKCTDAGWSVRDIPDTFLNTGDLLGAICEIPYRNATSKTNEEGCRVWQDNSKAYRFTSTAARLCRDLFDLRPVPTTLNHNEGDRYVHTCPGVKEPSADQKSCVCPAGLAENDSGACEVDIDECATGAHSCGDNAQCVNSDGGHFCTCDSGYSPSGDDWTLQNPQCADVDECAM